MISDKNLARYREDYSLAPYEKNALPGDPVCAPRRVVIINMLCDEVERLNARIKELESAQKPAADDQWDECLDEGISPTMRIEDRGAS